MTDDNHERQAIRQKTAEAIEMINNVMAIRHKMPHDQHDLNHLHGVARIMGETFVKERNNPDFDRVEALVQEHRDAAASLSPKQAAESHIALEAMAIAFGLQHQFSTTLSKIRQAEVADDGQSPPQASL